MYGGVGTKRKLMAILLCGAVVPTWKKHGEGLDCRNIHRWKTVIEVVVQESR